MPEHTLIKNLQFFEVAENFGGHTHTLAGTSRTITIVNDSTKRDLTFAFQSGRTPAVLKPTETMTMDITTKKIIMTGGGAHRIWVWG